MKDEQQQQKSCLCNDSKLREPTGYEVIVGSCQQQKDAEQRWFRSDRLAAGEAVQIADWTALLHSRRLWESCLCCHCH